MLVKKEKNDLVFSTSGNFVDEIEVEHYAFSTFGRAFKGDTHFVVDFNYFASEESKVLLYVPIDSDIGRVFLMSKDISLFLEGRLLKELFSLAESHIVYWLVKKFYYNALEEGMELKKNEIIDFLKSE